MAVNAMAAAALPDFGITWEEFLRLPEDVVRHAELVDGKVIVNAPTSLHQLVVGRLWSAIDVWCHEGEGRGEATMNPPVQVADDRGYLPDVAWYPAHRCAPEGERVAFEGPPGLAVEVLSPSTRQFDATRKVADYARVGVDELWLVDPQGPTAHVYRRPPESEWTLPYGPSVTLAFWMSLASPLLPDLSIDLQSLIRR